MSDVVKFEFSRHLRVWAILLSFSFCQGLFSQDKNFAKIEAAMQEAIDNGRNPDEPYVCNIEKKKITLLSLKNFIYSMQEKGCDYYFGAAHSKDYDKPSTKARADNFNFWKKSDYEDYICRHLLPDDLSISVLSQTGEGFLFFDEGRIRYEGFTPTDIMTGSGQYKNIRWSGNIDKDGFIDGEGTGFFLPNMVGFSGKFINGFPQGEVTYRYFTPNSALDNYEISTKTIRVGEQDGEWASLTVEGSRKFAKDFVYEVNRFGRIIKNREYTRKINEQNEINRKKTAFANRQKVSGYDLSAPEMSYDFLKKLKSILSEQRNRENKNIIDRVSLSLASKMANPVGMPDDLWDLADILKNNPQIANAKDVSITWDDSIKVNMKDVFYDYLYNHCWSPREKVLYLYNYVYNEWGNLSEDEILRTENNFVLTAKQSYFDSHYQQYFPKGRYVGKDYIEAWALAYIDYSKNMLKKNDAKLWLDSKDYHNGGTSYFDWLFYPRLSRNIGSYSESTSISSIMGALKKVPKRLLLNKNVLSFLESLFSKTEHVFKYYENREHKINYWAYNQMEKGNVVYEEAKKYRALLDAIGAAAQVDENTGVGIQNTNYGRNMVRWLACHDLVNYFYDGVIAARELSATTPEILPACKKAEEYMKQKFLILKKDIFDKYDDIWEEAIQKYNARVVAEQQENEEIRREVENMGLPKYEYIEKEWQGTFEDEVLSRTVKFDDLTGDILDDNWVNQTDILKAQDGSYYKARGGAFIFTKYKTEKDAIIATYAYLKYGIIRKKGQL